MRLRCRSFLQVVASQGPKTLEFVKVWGWSWDQEQISSVSGWFWRHSAHWTSSLGILQFQVASTSQCPPGTKLAIRHGLQFELHVFPKQLAASGWPKRSKQKSSTPEKDGGHTLFGSAWAFLPKKYFTSSDPTLILICHSSAISFGNIWYNLLTFYSGMLSGILSDILFWHSIWHLFWHFFLAFYLVYLRRFFAVEAQRGTLWSGACSWGPAGNTLIRSLRWRSGGDHSDPEVAVRVQRGTLRSRACSWGPAEEGGGRRRKEEKGRGRRKKEEEGGRKAGRLT